MFRVELIDIGNDGDITHFDTSVDTLAEAEVITKGEIGGYLGTQDIDLMYIEGLVYDVISGGVSVGAVAIKSL